MCRICGDDSEGPVVRYWDPDYGWKAGRLCEFCRPDALKARPKPSDLAWPKRNQLFGDLDEAITQIYG
jgi:hypothetical protein